MPPKKSPQAYQKPDVPVSKKISSEAQKTAREAAVAARRGTLRNGPKKDYSDADSGIGEPDSPMRDPGKGGRPKDYPSTWQNVYIPNRKRGRYKAEKKAAEVWVWYTTCDERPEANKKCEETTLVDDLTNKEVTGYFVMFDHAGIEQEVDGVTGVLKPCTYNPNKPQRPPSCHKIPWAHLREALDQLYAEWNDMLSKHGTSQNNFEKLVCWGKLSNLQCGHARCNGHQNHAEGQATSEAIAQVRWAIKQLPINGTKPEYKAYSTTEELNPSNA